MKAILASIFILISLSLPQFAYASNQVLTFGSLPSAQGWTYFGDSSESSVFTLAAGKLEMNAATSNSAYYRMNNAVDATKPATFSVTARALSGGTALNFWIDDGTYSVFYGISPNSITVFTASGSTVTLSGFDNTSSHIYELDTYLDHTFSLSRDGVQVRAAPMRLEAGVNVLLFGEGGLGKGTAEISSLSLSQPVPEPGTESLILLGSGVIAMRLARRKSDG